MVTRIDTIFSVTRHRELHRRRRATILHISLIISALAVPTILLWWYPTWTLLLWIIPLGAISILWKHSEKPKLSVSRDELALIVDAKLGTKERFQTFSYLSRSAEAPDLIRSAFIAHQIEESLPPSFAPDSIVSTALSSNQRLEIASIVTCVGIAVSLILFRPHSPLEKVAHQIVQIVRDNPSLPESVQQSALDTAALLSSADTNEARVALDQTRDEISRALQESMKSQDDELTISAPEASNDSRPQHAKHNEEPTQRPLDKTEPAQPKDTKNKRERQAQEPQKQTDPRENQDEPEQQKESTKSEGSEQSESSGDKKKNDQDNKESTESSESKEQSGKSQSSSQSDSEEAEQGEGQGSGQGSSGSGTGSQGEGQQEGRQSEGGSGKGKSAQGSGSGESSGEQGSEQNQPSSTQQESGQQKSGAPGQNGLQQLSAAMDNAEQELDKQDSSQNQTEQGQQGKNGEGESERGDQPGKKKNDTSSDKGKSSPQGKEGDDSNNQKEQNRGKGASQKGSSQENKKGNGKGETNTEDAQEASDNTGLTATNAKPPKNDAERPQNLPEGDLAEGSGEKSSMPDRSAQAVNDQPGEGPPSDIPKGTLGFKESHVTGEDEQFDARFTGSDSKLEESKTPARAKTTLDDVLLAKPRGSLQKGKQPIPLEYQDVLK